MRQSGMPEKNKWWRAYLALASLAFVASLVFGTHSPIKFLFYIFNGIGLVGLWGYISDKVVGWRLFWAVYLVLSLTLAAFNLVPSLWDGLRQDLGWVAFLLVAALIELPRWIALWRYAFRSPHIWQQAIAA